MGNCVCWTRFTNGGVLVLPKFQVTSQKVQVQQNFEFELAIAMLKCENLPSTNSTISGAQQNFSETSTPRMN